MTKINPGTLKLVKEYIYGDNYVAGWGLDQNIQDLLYNKRILELEELPFEYLFRLIPRRKIEEIKGSISGVTFGGIGYSDEISNFAKKECGGISSFGLQRRSLAKDPSGAWNGPLEMNLLPKEEQGIDGGYGWFCPLELNKQYQEKEITYKK